MAETMKRWVLAARPAGVPKLTDFRLEEAPVPPCPEGGVLVRVIWQSLDPYMRGRMDDVKSYAKSVGIGEVMEAGGVGEVMESKTAGFARGDIVNGPFGWASHAAVPAEGLRKVDPAQGPIQFAVGLFGMPGLTAWVGLTDIGQPKPGETIVVSAATGAVGSVVGQLAKARGLRVVGVAGGEDKCRWAVEELGFDACLDHRAAADAKALREGLALACPDGVDIFWENVGGKTLDAVLPLMNIGGRVPLCGTISAYSGNAAAEADRLPAAWRAILTKRLTVRGFIIFDHYHRMPAFLNEVPDLWRAGKIRYRESVTEGLEGAPQAFLDLLAGRNFGKAPVKVG